MQPFVRAMWKLSQCVVYKTGFKNGTVSCKLMCSSNLPLGWTGFQQLYCSSPSTPDEADKIVPEEALNQHNKVLPQGPIVPPPSEEFLEELTYEQRQHYSSILKQFEKLHKLEKLQVPDKMTNTMWLKLLSSGVRKTNSIMINFKKRELRKAQKIKKEVWRLENKQATEEDIKESPFLVQGYRKRTIKRFRCNRFYQSMEFGQKIVYDLGFVKTGDFREKSRIIRQLSSIIGLNSRQRDPFHIVFCNANSYSQSLINEVVSTLPPVTVTHKDYLELFPRNKLVYLSPNSPHPLQKIVPNDVYIVGCITDIHETKPLTLKKACEQKIRHACLPIKEYFGNPKKCILTLDQVQNIMNGLHMGSSWEEVFEWVPKRFVVDKENQDSYFPVKSKRNTWY